jgi:hypothetical protein
MKIICKIFGHNRIVRDWYQTDPVCSIACLRCGKILGSHINYSYNFNNLQKMVCIDNKKVNLTIGKVYEILYIRINDFFIKDDKGIVNAFNVQKFTTIVKYRKEKLKHLEHL